MTPKLDQPSGPAPIAFAPFRGLSRSLLEKIAAHFERKFHLEIEILPRVSLGSSFDTDRQQFVAEKLIDRLKGAYPGRAASTEVTLIGFTDRDMYMRGIPEWNFVFGSRRDYHIGVISSARMTIGLGPDDEARFEARVRKMTLRYLGLLYFYYGFTSDPSSVLYEDLLGLDDLDRMKERF